MTGARLAAVVVFVAAVAIGTLRDHVPARPRIVAEGYEILAGDFHVHAFFGDGGLAPWTLQQQAARVGLDVIAITNHNQTLAGRIGRWAARSEGPLVLVGEEITGRDYHVIAVGIERAVNWDQPARDAIAQVHEQGGVAIAAHPITGFVEGYDRSALDTLDGFEAAHPDSFEPGLAPQFEAFQRRATGVNPFIAAIGSSDVHTNGTMGLCRTFLLVRDRSPSSVIDAIRDGRTVGRCGDGALRGLPDRIRLVEPHLEALAPPREDSISGFAAIAMWVSLLSLAVLGPRGPAPGARAY